MCLLEKRGSSRKEKKTLQDVLLEENNQLYGGVILLPTQIW